MNKPQISIIVPVYKTEKYLRQCIESILAQTFTDFELILVDDGSPDDCGAICDSYARKDTRIHVIHQLNGGLSNARNAGIRYSEGRYLTFVDSDDMVSVNYCRILYQLLNNSQCDFSACECSRFDDHIELIPEDKREERVENYTNIEYLEKQLKSGFSAWGKLFKRSIFETHFFSPGKIHEDIFFCSDLARDFSAGVSYTNEKLYYYRQNTTGIMARSNIKCHPDRVLAGEYLYNTVKDIKPAISEEAFLYAVLYPWSFVDKIYVKRNFRDNKMFLLTLQRFLLEYKDSIQNCTKISDIVKHRMILFSRSFVLYGINALFRLTRVYIYHLIKRDAYKDGHGI